MFEGLQESGTVRASVPRAAFGLGTAFEELEKVVRDGRGILLSHLRVHVGVGGGDVGLACLPDCPREAEEVEKSVGRRIRAEDETVCACLGDIGPGGGGVLGNHAHRRGSHWALGVQMLQIFSSATAEDAGSVRRVPPVQSRREAPRAHAGREGVVCEKAGVEPELGWEVGWE